MIEKEDLFQDARGGSLEKESILKSDIKYEQKQTSDKKKSNLMQYEKEESKVMAIVPNT